MKVTSIPAEDLRLKQRHDRSRMPLGRLLFLSVAPLSFPPIAVNIWKNKCEN